MVRVSMDNSFVLLFYNFPKYIHSASVAVFCCFLGSLISSYIVQIISGRLGIILFAPIHTGITTVMIFHRNCHSTVRPLHFSLCLSSLLITFMSTKPLHVRFLHSHTTNSRLLLVMFMQFALLDFKLCLAYFQDLILLISLYCHTGAPVLIFPSIPIHVKV